MTARVEPSHGEVRPGGERTVAVFHCVVPGTPVFRKGLG